jgi:YceI-like domain
VFKSGLFSAFADNHEIRAPISGSFLDEAGRRAELVIDSRQLVVLDPGLAPEKRHEVQQWMLGPEVLDSDRFREIRFEASKVEHFLVSGSLSLHGRTRTISLHVQGSNGCYHGDAVLKQRDFWNYSSKRGPRHSAGYRRLGEKKDEHGANEEEQAYGRK